ncbi:MAG: hypothetical protein LBU65_06270 [Planctomycetaceae bacterium]|nr:hypothetical protein [Planctomycetaceae bacterium]
MNLYFADFGKHIELIVDSGYAKKSVLVPLSQEKSICVITRIRKDAKLFDLPPRREKGHSRPKLKGDKICMNLRASHNQGWQEVECQLYSKSVTKTYKMFVAVNG